ncbi:hypothetical protein VPH35_129478 [Triticum aestivum]
MPGLVSFFLRLIREDGHGYRLTTRRRHGVGGLRRFRCRMQAIRRFDRMSLDAATMALGGARVEVTTPLDAAAAPPDALTAVLLVPVAIRRWGLTPGWWPAQALLQRMVPQSRLLRPPGLRLHPLHLRWPGSRRDRQRQAVAARGWQRQVVTWSCQPVRFAQPPLATWPRHLRSRVAVDALPILRRRDPMGALSSSSPLGKETSSVLCR